jgi:hypothetical protein
MFFYKTLCLIWSLAAFAKLPYGSSAMGCSLPNSQRTCFLIYLCSIASSSDSQCVFQVSLNVFSYYSRHFHLALGFESIGRERHVSSRCVENASSKLV